MSVRSLLTRSRRRLPSGLQRTAKAALTGWGMLTADLRMLPDFIVVGAQRSGTTTLFRVLNDHPDIVRPTASKGIGYFEVNYGKGRRWYRSHFPVRLLANLRTRGRAVTYESSGYYLFHPLAAERIARDLPGVRIVVMVRDPVERAYSAHRHELRRGYETEEFEAALALEPARLAGEEDRIRADPATDRYEHRHHGYLARSRYAGQIRRFVDALGADHVHIVDADRFFAEPAAELTSLFAWLGISPWLPDEVDQWNAQPREPMAAELRERLAAGFADSDAELAGLMGREPSWVAARAEPDQRA
jgi:hypothetical protein